MTESDSQLSFSIIDSKMTVQAMRDSGYKSTTHALAELIDNSIESGATAIEIFGVSRRDDRTGRLTLKELAVLDNGEVWTNMLSGEACVMVMELVGSDRESAVSALGFPIRRCHRQGR